MADNKIYPFAQPATPPNILSDADYAANTTVTSTGYLPESIASSALMSKAQRQTSAIAAGIAQWIADNQVSEVNDSLSPATLAGMITAGLSSVNLTTQPQFDDSQKAATTEFVQRALGNLSSSAAYGVNANLDDGDIGKTVLPSSAGLAFGLPLVADLPNGAQIRFSGNGHGCAISRQGSDVIKNGTSGNVSAVSVLEYDVVELTVIGGVWTVTGGNVQLNASSQFSSSLATNGYQYLPGGQIEQWGHTVGNIPANTSSTVTLPFSFPNEILNIQLTPAAVNHNASSSSAAAEIISASQFVIHNWGVIDFSSGVYYRVIGR